MKKKIENIKKSDVGKDKNNLKNANIDSEKKKKKKKKKKITKDKIENEDKIEITEKNELLENIKINKYDENEDNLISKIKSYINQRKDVMTNDLLNKYYYVDKKTPFFFIDIRMYKCICDSFLCVSLKDKIMLSNKKSNLLYEQYSVYFYNVINSKCLNTISFFLKEFFKEHELEYFENCCEIMQLTQLLFFILLTDYYFLSYSIKKYCIENFKTLFRLKNYLFNKYIKYKNKSTLSKFVLLNKMQNDNMKNDYFIFETKIINEIQNDNKIEFDNMTMHIISTKKLDKYYFISLVTKVKSYEYINDYIFLDLFKIHIFTNPCASTSSFSFSPNSILQECNKESNYNYRTVFVLSEVTNLFPSEISEQLFSYTYEIEIPPDIYTNEELEIFYIETNEKVKCLNFCDVDNLLKEEQINSVSPIYKEKDKKEDITKEYVDSPNAYENSNNKQCYINNNNNSSNIRNNSSNSGNNSVHRDYEKMNIGGSTILIEDYFTHANAMNQNDDKQIDISNEENQEILKECNKIILNDEINLVKVKSKIFTLNNKNFLKIYSNRISNYYINLNNVNNFPYIKWEIKYIDNIVIIKLKSKIANEFIFHISNNGIVLLDNGIDVLKDIYNYTLDVYTLLFLMKKKGINFLVTHIEMEKMKKVCNYHLNDEKTEENIINDILLCFRFINFYSSGINSAQYKTMKIAKGNAEILKGLLTNSLYMEYEHNTCR
ncbi:conserved Plasmodium protein, unknown function [Plasmodium malariae]|nr:conserved Plasmodium protein, unknown function [Plasmodium malariae]